MSRKTFMRIGIALLVLLMVGGGVAYWIYIHIHVSTDDAYVAGYVGVISPRVPGRVAKVLVDNNQHVVPGQVLLTLEPQDYQAALAQARRIGRLSPRPPLAGLPIGLKDIFDTADMPTENGTVLHAGRQPAAGPRTGAHGAAGRRAAYCALELRGPQDDNHAGAC